MAATNGSTTQVSALTTSQQLIGANGGRAKEPGAPSVIIANDSSAMMYILLGDNSQTASSSNFTYALAGNGGSAAGTVTINGYCGPIQAAWASATGRAQVTELV